MVCPGPESRACRHGSPRKLGNPVAAVVEMRDGGIAQILEETPLGGICSEGGTKKQVLDGIQGRRG